MPVFCGFVHEPFALEHAEAVLFVNGDKAEALKFHIVLDKGVRPDDEFRFTGMDALQRRSLFR